MATPEEEIRILLEAVPDLTFKENLFEGPERPQKDGLFPPTAVFCTDTGGPPPEMYVQGVSEECEDTRFSAVQVSVRSDPEEYGAGKALADACYEAIHKVIPPGYIETTVRESSPVYLGLNSTESHRWVLNVMTTREA